MTTRLTREEEAIAVSKYQTAGDKESLAVLVESQMGVIINKATKMCGSYDQLDDLIQEGVIGAIKAIKKFDISRGYVLSTYAIKCATGAMKDYIYDQMAITTGESLDCDIETGSIYDSPQDYAEKLQLQERVDEYVNNLPELEADSFLAYTLRPKTAKEVCVKHNVWQNWVWLLAKKTKKELMDSLCIKES